MQRKDFLFMEHSYRIKFKPTHFSSNNFNGVNAGKNLATPAIV